MSKKNLFKGGAVLFFVMILALIGCRGAGDSIPPVPALSIDQVALGPDMVIVTFTDTLANIDKAKGPDYTTKAANYNVVKTGAGGGGETPLTVTNVTKGADDNTVTLAITGVHTDFAAADSIKVELIGLDKPATYKPAKPAIDEISATSGTTIRITFTDGVKFSGEDTPEGQFALSEGSFTISAAKVLTTDPRVVEITVTDGTITPTTKMTISYTSVDAKKLTSITGLDVDNFTGQTVSIQFPLTAAVNDGSAATGFALTFSEALYDGKTQLAVGSNVTALFDKEGTGTISSATVDASNAKIIAFVIAGAAKGDKVIPKAAKTVTTQGGIPWKQIVSWNEEVWAASAP
jgi:hypothetical protein